MTIALVCAVVLGLGSCSKESKSLETSKGIELTIENFNKILEQDYNSIKDTFPEVMFYESQISFTDVVTSDTLGLKSICNVFQAGRFSYQICHEDGKKEVIKKEDYWLEDVQIDPTKIITLDSAITRLMMADIVKPKSAKVTLRNPLGPKLLNPGYIFGQLREGFVKVDAIDGSVTQMK